VRRLVLLAALVFSASAAPAPSAEQVSGVRAKAFAARLAALGPRPAGSANELRADRMVERELRGLGYRVAIQPFPLPRGGQSRNVVGRTPGPLRAIVVAHIDGVGEGPAANDNGSGVGAMLEVAREVAGRQGVLVAALGAEERVETGSPLHLGSARLVRGLSRADRRTVRVALSMDMVAVGPTLNVRGLEAAPNRSARLALQEARRLRVPASYLRDSGLSDHTELTRAGIPAAWIEWRWDTCWHTACDRANRLSVSKLAVAARLALETARRQLAPSGRLQ
jgi:Zn-dependent M28 family amino/carboxypeptidase